MNITLKNCDWINKVTCCNGETVYPLTNANQVEYISGYDSSDNPIIGTLQDWIDAQVYVLYAGINNYVFSSDTEEGVAALYTSTIEFGLRNTELSEFKVLTPVIRKYYPVIEPDQTGTRDYAEYPYYGLIKLEPTNFIIDEDTDEVSLDIQFVEGDYSVDAYGKCNIGYLANHYNPSDPNFIKYGDDMKISLPEIRAYINNDNLVLQTVINNIIESQDTVSVDDIVGAVLANDTFQSAVSSRYTLVYNASLQRITLQNTIDGTTTDISTINLQIPSYAFDQDLFIVSGGTVTLNTSAINYTAAENSGLTFDQENRTIGHTNIVGSGTATPSFQDGILQVPSFTYDVNGHIVNVQNQAFDVCNGDGKCCCEKMNVYPFNLKGYSKDNDPLLKVIISNSNLKSYAHIYESLAIADDSIGQIIFDVWFTTPRKTMSFVVNFAKDGGDYTITNVQLVSASVDLLSASGDYFSNVASLIGSNFYSGISKNDLIDYALIDSVSKSRFLIWVDNNKLHFAIGTFIYENASWKVSSTENAFPSTMLSEGEDVYITVRTTVNVWDNANTCLSTQNVTDTTKPNVVNTDLLTLNNYSSINGQNPYISIHTDNGYEDTYVLSDDLIGDSCKEFYIPVKKDVNAPIYLKLNQDNIYITGQYSIGSYNASTHKFTLGNDNLIYIIKVSKLYNILHDPYYLYDIKELKQG